MQTCCVASLLTTESGTGQENRSGPQSSTRLSAIWAGDAIDSSCLTAALLNFLSNPEA